MLKRFQKLNLHQVLKYGVGAILLAVPLYPKFPFLTVPGTYVSIRLEDFLILVVFLVWLVYVRRSFREIWRSNVNKALFLFLAVALLSTIAGIFLTHTAVPHIGILHWGRRVEYFLGFLIGASVIKSREDLIFYIKCLGIVIIGALVIGIGQKHFNFPVIVTQNTEYSKGVALRYFPGGHLVTTFAGHYDLATYVVLVSPLFFTLLFATRETIIKFFGKDGRAPRLLVLGVIIAAFWLLVNSASRISIASYLGGVCLALLLIRKYKYIAIFLFISLIFISTSMNLISRYTRIIEVTIDRLMSVPVGTIYAQEVKLINPSPTPMPVFEDRSTSIRVNVEWPRAIRAFMKNPVLGTGLSSITLATDNDYLRMLGEVGLLGFAAWILLMIHIVKFLISRVRKIKEINLETVYFVGVMAALPGVLLNATFIDVFEASKFAIVFWLMLGFAVGLAKLNEKKA